MNDFIDYFTVERSASGTLGDPNGDVYGTLDAPVTNLGTFYGSATTASHVVPARGATVTVQVISSSWMTVGYRVNEPGGGAYTVISKPTNTTAVLQYQDRVENVQAGATIASGTVIVPGEFDEMISPSPEFYYRPTGHTNGGLSIQYNVTKVSAVVPGTTIAGSALRIFGTGANFASDYAEVISMATDSAGNLALAIQYTGSVNFAGEVLDSGDTGPRRMAVLKLTPNGTKIWAKKFLSAATVKIGQIAFTSAGDVVVNGHFQGSINCGGGSMSANGAFDIFVAKLSGVDGHQLWANHYGVSGNSEITTGIMVGGDGSVISTGYFSGTVDFGGVGHVLTSGGNNVFVLSLASVDGTTNWVKQAIGSYSQGYAIAAVPGGLLTAGFFAGSATWGTISKTSLGTLDMFVTAYDLSGNVLSVRTYAAKNSSSSGVIFPRSIAVNGSNYAICGTYTGPANLGGSPFNIPTVPAIFLALYQLDGTHVWSNGYGIGSGFDSAVGSCVVLDAASNAYMTGTVRNGIDFGNGNLLVYPGTNVDPFVAKFDNVGMCKWASRYYTPNSDIDSGNAIVFSAGTLWLGGKYSGTIDLATNAGTLTAFSGANTDGFLVKLAP